VLLLKQDLLDLRAYENPIAREVTDEIPPHHVFRRLDHRVGDERRPADRGGDAREHDVAHLESQGPERNEDEGRQEGRHLQIEGGRLAVLEVETPDQHHQERQIDDDAQREQHPSEHVRVSEDQADRGHRGVGAEHPGERLDMRRGQHGRHGRQAIDQREGHDDAELHPGDQDFGLSLLRADGGARPLRQVALERRAAQGRSTMPSRVTTAPGSAFPASTAMASMKTSSWPGSWWKIAKVFTPAALASFAPSCQVEWPQLTLEGYSASV
jgi:hypothetical protein